ncbi:S-ribosylhomocysteine lyase, partial [Corynebacterium hesseae]|uniref:S-ribosylhomocysteine lyase n=1 Tax=Corynebacterium hesseae TaxID=2913502 RepID=UPI00373E43A9
KVGATADDEVVLGGVVKRCQRSDGGLSAGADILNATEVPAANEVQCGWGAHHSLEGAQEAARNFLAAKEEWLNVMA